ncbi:MAG: hypothetical protein DKM50_09985 [Candidatus Margulisiibacteriota bacterium]|nr:MAG: hypothetical protein A2X43_04070 [Candidatus Margulisbacteria bacterium GWD2_39_127]OGI05177.1 MAG: hypothetical protein A2X42_02580 [Candidatus Margulisbacteria bacterium GWF2_38_17]OGI06226.1 MAG: hypothetical protein A2X41_08160 [Candidatus Margulisbacteria bacterium GWE2_39_32]PZM78882.1 MAG: hypothetical protein DKM50_09985 [Candidatus Margulisiibacteriota bacterium]HAR64536.1 hypothetical protein [Candidatus Margulisiibacteriota bacterium]
MRKLLSLIVIIILAQNVAGAFSFNIDKPGTYLSSKSGKVINGTVVVANTGKDTLYFKSYIADWKILPDGSKAFYPAGSTGLSSAPWLSIYPKEFAVEPLGKEKISYIMTVPKNAVGGHYSVIFFETYDKNNTKNNILFSGRIGSIIYHQVEGTEKIDANLTDVFVDYKNGKRTVSYMFENMGNIFLLVKPSLAILNDRGQVAFRESMDKFGVLPGQKIVRTYKVSQKLPDGDYTALITTEYGKEDFKVVEKEFRSINQGGNALNLLNKSDAAITINYNKSTSSETVSRRENLGLAQKISIEKFNPVVNKNKIKLFVLLKNPIEEAISANALITVSDAFRNKKLMVSLGRNFQIANKGKKIMNKIIGHSLAAGTYTVTLDVMNGIDTLAKDEKTIVIR